MAISERQIKYGFGLSGSMLSTSMSEGLPVMAHVQPEPVTDGTTKPAVVGSMPGASSSHWDIGGIYWSAEYQIPYSPALVSQLMKGFFVDSTPGPGPGYIRTYAMSQIQAIPSQFLSVLKSTRKATSSLIDAYYGGLIIGWSIEGAEGQVMSFRIRVVFARENLAMTYPSVSAWDLNKTGNWAPNKFNEVNLYVIPEGAGMTELKINKLSLICQGAGAPTFYDTQNPSRWTRESPEISGSFSCRDITEEVKTLSDARRDGAMITMIISISSTTAIVIYCKLHAGMGEEVSPTRFGNFNFTGVVVSGTDSPLSWQLTPGRS